MYRLTAGIVPIYKGLVLSCLKSSLNLTRQPYWGMPQGGMDPGESPFEAAQRELLEETGMQEVDWLLETDWYTCLFPADIVVPGFIGQQYKWFVCACKSDKVVLSEEHLDYKWTTPEAILEDIRKSLVVFKYDMYLEVLQKAQKFL